MFESIPSHLLATDIYHDTKDPEDRKLSLKEKYKVSFQSPTFLVPDARPDMGNKLHSTKSLCLTFVHTDKPNVADDGG